MTDDSSKLVDADWAKMPGILKWNSRKREKEFKSIVPQILRNLAPSSGFNAQEVWEQEKLKDEQLARQEGELREDKSKEKESKGKKSKKIEELVARNISIKADVSKFMCR